MLKKLITSTTLLALLVCAPLTVETTAYAADRSDPTDNSYSAVVAERSAGIVKIISADTMRLHLATGVSVDTMKATITQNGVTEELPVRAVDRNANPVWVTYSKASNGDILVRVSSLGGERGAWRCITGIGGGAVTGAGTLGLGGAAVGSLSIPVIGSVPGGAVGAIVGAIGGGLTGAATFCW